MAFGLKSTDEDVHCPEFSDSPIIRFQFIVTALAYATAAAGQFFGGGIKIAGSSAKRASPLLLSICVQGVDLR